MKYASASSQHVWSSKSAWVESLAQGQFIATGSGSPLLAVIAAATASAETEAAKFGARIEVQAAAVADLDARLSQIDAAIFEMTRRGRATFAWGGWGGLRR
jgi:hypothetical protein